MVTVDVADISLPNSVIHPYCVSRLEQGFQTQAWGCGVPWKIFEICIGAMRQGCKQCPSKDGLR